MYPQLRSEIYIITTDYTNNNTITEWNSREIIKVTSNVYLIFYLLKYSGWIIKEKANGLLKRYTFINEFCMLSFEG